MQGFGYLSSVKLPVITGELDEEQTTGYIRDHHTGLVSRELWDKVQARFEERKRIREQSKDGGEEGD